MTTTIFTLFTRNPDHKPGPEKGSFDMTSEEFNASLEDDGSVIEEECFASTRAETLEYFKAQGFDTGAATIAERGFHGAAA